MNRAEYAAMFHVEDTLWWYVGMRAVVRSLVGARLDEAVRVLDAGCGTGGTLAWWHGRSLPKSERVGAGIDLSRDALSFGARRGLTCLSRASVSDLPFADGAFDGVLSLDVIYHLDVADDRRALSEIARVVRPGGWACVRVPAFNTLRSAHDVAVHTRQRYRLSELVDRVAHAGLVVDRATYANALLFPAAIASRIARRGEHANMRVASATEPSSKASAPPTPTPESQPPAEAQTTALFAGVADPSGRGGSVSPAHEAISDVRPASALVQAIGSVALRAEATLLQWLDLPLGLSAVVVASRPLHGS